MKINIVRNSAKDKFAHSIYDLHLKLHLCHALCADFPFFGRIGNITQDSTASDPRADYDLGSEPMCGSNDICILCLILPESNEVKPVSVK